MKGQAKVGGEIGVNGEYYKGGQFMPNSKKTIKGSNNVANKKNVRKTLIEPNVFEITDKKSIFSIIVQFVDFNDEGLMIRKSSISDKTLEYYGLIDTLSDMINKYNSGERYIKEE